MQQFPYGAVYFRKSNPPESDWERDTAQAAREGMNAFRHWFVWSGIEVKPGRFVWDDYDRHMDLAARHGIGVIIAEITTQVPLWLFRRRPELFSRPSRDRTPTAGMNASSATGTTGWICLDNAEGKELVDRFLRELVSRYRGHEALLGYDVSNEGHFGNYPVFHPDTFEAYRQWLRAKYGSLDELNTAWRRYSMADWEDVEPTDHGDQPSPEALDLWRFKRDRYYEHVERRIALIRELDPDHLIVTHSGPPVPGGGADTCRFARHADVSGLTWVASRHGNAPWMQWHAVDAARAAARAAARGRPFWHAEAQGGPLWLQPQVPGRPREDGRITTAENVRIWNLTSIAGGARGMFYTRWRGLLDPPLWDAFGLHSLDGSPNPRSDMATRLARWTNHPDQAELMKAAPWRGELAILDLPESMAYHRMLYSTHPGRENVTKPMLGAYRGFFDLGVQADWVRIEHIDEYPVVYMPHAIQMHPSQADCLKQWVANGGILIAEACPGYFDSGGRAGTRQPGLGLDELFGARETNVEFMPDLGGEITFRVLGESARGGLYRQVYEPVTGESCGTFPDGSCAAVAHSYGKGRTLLLGSYPSVGYFVSEGAENGDYFRRVLAWSGIEPRTTTSDPSVVARVHGAGEQVFLWVLNMTAEDRTVAVRLSPSVGTVRFAHALWGRLAAKRVQDNTLHLSLPAQDGLALRLERQTP